MTYEETQYRETKKYFPDLSPDKRYWRRLSKNLVNYQKVNQTIEHKSNGKNTNSRKHEILPTLDTKGNVRLSCTVKGINDNNTGIQIKQ